MNQQQLRKHLMPPELLASLPPLYSQEKVEDPKIVAKYFVPWGAGTWYVIEGQEEDGDVRFFGLVDLHEKELGYFVLSEFMSIRGPGGLTIERDLHFGEHKLSEFR